VKTRVLMILGAAAAIASSVPAAPAAAMDLSTVDCAQSASMMMMKPDSGAMMGDHAMGSPAPAMAMTTDDAFNGSMHMMMSHATMMAGVELKCGKDPKARAMAAKLLQQLNDDGSMEAMDILHTYNH
jgi:hypothetical protein